MNVFSDFKKIIHNEQAFVWLSSMVLITLPLKHSINSLTIIALFVYSIFNVVINRNRIDLKPNRISIVLMVIYLLSIVSLIWTITIEKSTEGLVQKLSYIILPLIFIFTSNSNQISGQKIFKYFSFAMVFYAVYCLIHGVINLYNTGNSSHLFYHELSGTVNNMNAIYMSVYASFALLFFTYRPNKRVVDYVSFVILSIFLVLLSSKIIIAVTIFVCVVSLFSLQYLTKKNKHKLLFIGIITILILPFSRNVQSRFSTEFEKTNVKEVFQKKEFGKVYLWTGSGLRLFQLRLFIELVQEDNLYLKGYGIDASQEKLTEKYKDYNLYDGFYTYNFHNQYVQIFAELGIVGFLMLIFLFSLCFNIAIKKKDYFFLSFLFLIAILCLTESYLWRQRGMVFFIMIILLFRREFEITKTTD